MKGAWACDSNASWRLLSSGIIGTSNWEETMQKAQEMLEGYCMSLGLGIPWSLPERAGDGAISWPDQAMANIPEKNFIHQGQLVAQQ